MFWVKAVVNYLHVVFGIKFFIVVLIVRHRVQSFEGVLLEFSSCVYVWVSISNNIRRYTDVLSLIVISVFVNNNV
jgi:hypothetical protein